MNEKEPVRMCGPDEKPPVDALMEMGMWPKDDKDTELATLRRRVAELEGGICILLGIIASSGAELDRFEMSSLRQVREVLESKAKQPAPATEKQG